MKKLLSIALSLALLLAGCGASLEKKMEQDFIARYEGGVALWDKVVIDDRAYGKRGAVLYSDGVFTMQLRQPDGLYLETLIYTPSAGTSFRFSSTSERIAP